MTFVLQSKVSTKPPFSNYHELTRWVHGAVGHSCCVCMGACTWAHTLGPTVQPSHISTLQPPEPPPARCWAQLLAVLHADQFAQLSDHLTALHFDLGVHREGVDVAFGNPADPKTYPVGRFDVVYDNNGKDLESCKPLIDAFKVGSVNGCGTQCESELP